MMNEQERNKAYYQALESVVTPEKLVLEIGTGSGLLAMMIARLGARRIVTCEAVELIADTARRIVKRNHYQDQITVLAKLSSAVELDQDLPGKADVLVHEIFASDLLGEHLLDAIEDAKQRLLKPDGHVLPSAASIMIALVGGAELGQHLRVEESFGFDLRDFNAINAKRGPLYRHDLETLLLSDDVEAFRFDFLNDATFPAESKVIEIEVKESGLCYGVIQWIRIELSRDVHFENHPSRRRPIANWQNIVHRFDEPIHLEAGAVVSITAAHNRQQPWFELTDERLAGGAPKPSNSGE
jgi:type II protein arginine methyltransferase